MSKQRIEDCYFEHNSTIFSEMLGEDEEYLRLKKAKRAAEEALQLSLIHISEPTRP